MFPKKKATGSFEPGASGQLPNTPRENGPYDTAGLSSAQKPTSPQGFDFGLGRPNPTPSPAESSSSANSQRRSGHGRSASHPFPALFGGMGFKRDGIKPDRVPPVESSRPKGGKGSHTLLSSSLPKTAPRPQTGVDGDMVSGRCATCDATVRWPRHLNTFRCTACHMVNNLQYDTAADMPLGSSMGEQLYAPHPFRRVAPISLDRTRSLANQCTHTFLRRKLERRPEALAAATAALEDMTTANSEQTRKKAVSREAQRPKITADMLEVPTLTPQRAFPGDRRQSRSPSQPRSRSQRLTEEESRPRTSHSQPRPSIDGEREMDAKDVYRQLENYLVSCMSDCASLNISFAIARPPGPQRGVSESGNQETRKSESVEGLDGYLGEIDAKMLLLGDLGENARFWTGDRFETMDGHQTLASPISPGNDRRPPRFNWRQVWQWYQSLLNCGRQWRSMRSAFKEEERHFLEDPKVESEIDTALAEGRHHVQRTLLKSTEKLLTHPGLPVKRPEDSRFLLILLSNPLFHPRQAQLGLMPSAHGAIGISNTGGPIHLEQNLSISPHARSRSAAASRGNATGHHSGVIKRILGLLGNLPSETHQVMISWLCRMPEPQLRDLVELVSGFMSYRLTRNEGRARASSLDPTDGLIPVLGGTSSGSIAQLHAAVATTADASNPSAHRTHKTRETNRSKDNAYADDWQVKAAARVMSLLFFANFGNSRIRQQSHEDNPGGPRHEQFYRPGQVLPVSAFYNVLLDAADLTTDFEQWELKRNKFSFCQYPMFLSIWAKIRLMEFDAKRQMTTKARNAFFDKIMKGKNASQHLILHVRRDCVVEDSLNEISHVVGSEDIKKGLKIEFEGEEGVDVGGLRKEWFLLLVREVFDPRNGLFLYDEDSQFCYFNPHTFETSDQFYLIGVVLGLAIYNSTILDITLPPFLFRKLLAAAPPWTGPSISAPKPQITYTLDDLAEWRPNLARGLRQLLEYDGDVEATFCRDFVVDVDRYGTMSQVPLCTNGHKRPVTSSNRREFVDLYVRYVLDTSVSRQFEPFKRGFFTVCSGSALGLFRPEEIELLIRGSDEPLDVSSLQSVAEYDGWGSNPDTHDQVHWFWQTFEEAEPRDQRRLLGFVTGSDRIPAMGATSLIIKIGHLGEDERRFPIARTCFNMIGLYDYQSKEQLEHKLWTAVGWSEGFGLK